MGFVNFMLLDEFFQDSLNQFLIEGKLIFIIKTHLIVYLLVDFTQGCSSFVPFLVYEAQSLQLDLIE